MARKLKNMTLANRKITSKVLSYQLREYGSNVSPRTIRRTLNEQGLRAYKPTKKQKITPAMAKKRLEWAKGIQFTEDDWNKVCFSDESIFQISDESSQFVRRRPNEAFHPDCIKQTVKHPTSIMVWSVMSVHGPGRLYIVENTMRQDQYLNVIKKRLLPQVNEWYPSGEFIFMHDGAPCHQARSIKEFLSKEEISVMPWPGNSPDMNPIENLWAIVKRQLQKTKITTKQQLIEELIRVWHHNEEIKISCANLIKSMPKRLKMLIKSKGMHTKY